MAEQPIKGSQIVEDGALDNHIDQLNKTIAGYDRWEKQVKELSATIKKSATGLSPTKAGDLKEAAQQTKLLTDAIIRQEKVQQAKIRTESQLLTLQNKKATQLKKANTQAIKDRKAIRESTSEYIKQRKSLSTLNAALAELSTRGRTTGKVYRGLLIEQKKVREEYEKTNKTLGRSQFAVGRYENAWKSLRGQIIGGLGIVSVVRGLGRLSSELITTASELKGIEFAFDRLGAKGQKAFEQVRASTRGLLSDSSIKQSLVEFDNFNISLEQSGKLFEFLAVRSAQTGVSIDKLKSSLVEGLSKESKLRIDNLGISTAQLNAELEKTPDFVQAVANIAEEEVKRAGDVLDEAGNSQQRWNVLMKNTKDQLAVFLIPAFEKLFKVLTFVGRNFKNIAKVVGIGISAWASYRLTVKLASLEMSKFKKTGIVIFMGNLLKSIKAGSLSLKGMAVGFKGVGAAIKSIPLAGLISGITTIATTVLSFTGILGGNTEEIDNNTDALKDNNKEVLESIRLKEELSGIQKTIEGQLSNITKISNAQLKSLKEEIENTESLIETLSIEELKEQNLLTEDQLKSISKIEAERLEILSAESDIILASSELMSETTQSAQNLNQQYLQSETLKNNELDAVTKIKEGLDNALKSEEFKDDIQKRLIENTNKQNAILSEITNNEDLRTDNQKEQLRLVNEEIKRRNIQDKGDSNRSGRIAKELTGIDEMNRLRGLAEKELNDQLVSGLGIENEKTKELREQLSIIDFQIQKYQFLRKEGGFDGTEEFGRVEGREAGSIDSGESLGLQIEEETEEIIDSIEDRNEQLAKLAQSSTDVAIFFANQRIEALDRENEAEQRKYDEAANRIEQLNNLRANEGANIAESLAFEKKAQAEALAEQERIAKRKEKAALRIATLNAFNSSIQSGSGDPLVDTISQVSQLLTFINDAPEFWEGTETTVGDTLGQKVSNGRDGILARVDKDEIILNKEKSDQLSGMTTDQITRFALMGQNGINSMGVKLSSVTPMFESNKKELQEMQQTLNKIANKPTSQFSLETLGNVTKLIEKEYKHNAVTTRIQHKRLGR